MKKLTKTNVQRFLGAAKKKYGVKVVTKRSSVYNIIKWAVDAMDIPKVDKWLDRWSITIGRLIWLSFKPGAGTEADLRDQVITICHELIHFRQWRRDKARFIFRYVFSQSRRSHYEAEALHANVEMAYALDMKPDYKTIAYKLRSYKVRKSDIAVTRKHLLIIDRIAKQGGRTDEVTKWACKWWGI